MQRIGWLDAAKGIAIIGIVLIHAQSLAPAESTVARWVLERLVVSLPVFFVVSGIVSGRGLADPAADRKRLVRRVLPLLYLYLLWQPVVLGYRILDDVTTGTPVDLVGELTRVAAAAVRPNGEIWYLWALAIHLVLVWCTRRLPTAAVLVPLALVAAFVIGWGRSVVGDDLWHVLGPGLQGLPQYAFFTAAGARLAPFVLDRVRRTTTAQTLVVVALWLGVGWAYTLVGQGVGSALGVLQVTIGTVATLLVAGRIAAHAAPLRHLGQWSVVPYLTHTAVIVVVLALAAAGGVTDRLSEAPGLTVAGLTAVGTLAALTVFWPLRRTRLRFAFEMPTRRHDTGRRRASRPSGGRRIRRGRSGRPASAAAQQQQHRRATTPR